MAIYTSVLALALLSTLASALDQMYIFGCPDNHRDQADDSVSYANAINIAALSVRFLSGGPYKVIAGAESEESRRFSCITMTPVANIIEIKYYYNGLQKTSSLTWDPFAAVLKGRIAKGLLNSPADDYDVKFTVISYRDGIVALKTCKNGLLVHFDSTYIMVDNTIDKSAVNMDCLGPMYDDKFKIESWPKGICA